MLRPAAFLCLALSLSPLAARAGDTECMYTAKSLPANAPRAADYPAKPWSGQHAPVSMATPIARLFRTVLRGEAKQPPNFAGHYRLATWGCGAGCVGWALIDARTGQVITLPAYRNVDNFYGLVADMGPLIYTADSRLLIVAGGDADSETPRHDGLTYLLWTGNGFNKLAFYPRSKVCQVIDIDHVPPTR